MPTVAIVGPTGYSGLELIRLLLRHPLAHVSYLAARRDVGMPISRVWPSLSKRAAGVLAPIDADAIAAAANTAFLCLPNGLAMELAPQLLSRDVRVIDLSADYRYDDPTLFEQVYRMPHKDAERLGRREAVYGLCEANRGRIRRARLIANPGCYATAVQLALLPLLRADLIDPTDIVVSAASGISGAGREPKPEHHFPHRTENFEAYNVGVHRHQSEIEQQLMAASGQEQVRVLFVPHLVPMVRGILATCFCRPRDERMLSEGVVQIFEKAYSGEAFIRMREDMPAAADVTNTNFVDLTIRVAKGRIVVLAALDNLVKGAAGQAIQNFNIMHGLEETAGLL